MIAGDQLKRIAREAGLAAGVLEKDYALTWLLKGFYSRSSPLKNTLVFKGGTAIRKVYFPETWRFSEDLDFTAVGNKGQAAFRDGMQEALGWLGAQSGINYSVDTFHSTEGAIIASVQFVGPLGFPNRIKHDITLNEKLVAKPLRKEVVTIYPDLPKLKVMVYSLTEILAEKIRTIMQRGYSRDYYDVWRLLKEGKFSKNEVRATLRKKCELKGIEYQPKLLFDTGRLADAKAFWSAGLGYLTRQLPDFDTVISELREALGLLED